MIVGTNRTGFFVLFGPSRERWVDCSVGGGSGVCEICDSFYFCFYSSQNRAHRVQSFFVVIYL